MDASRATDLEVTTTSKFKPFEDCLNAKNTARARFLDSDMRYPSGNRKCFGPQYTTVGPEVMCWIMDVEPTKRCNLWVSVQKLVSKMTPGRRHKSYEERPNHLGVCCLRRRRTCGDLMKALEIVKDVSGMKREELFTLMSNADT